MKKIILLFGIFCFTQTFALTSSLEIDKNKAQVDERVNLKLTINYGDDEQISVKEIKGIENFSIVGQSQSSNYLNNNGKINSVMELEFALSPKKKGNYDIGPVVLNDGKKDILTNSVKIDISGEKMFLNNSNNLNIGNNQKQNLGNISSLEENTQKFQEKADYKIFLLIFIISTLMFIVYFSLRKLNQTSIITSFPEQDGDDKKYITFPNITDEDFLIKIDEIIKQKINKKYKINTKTKSYSQILEIIDNDSDKQKLKEIFDIIIQAKYSNIITNNEKLHDLVNEFTI